MKEMNYGFLPQYKIHNCCERASRELPYRDFLRYVVFINGYAYATNLCIMARARIDKISNLRSDDIDKLNGRAILWQSYRKMLSYRTIRILPTGIECCNGKDELIIFRTKELIAAQKKMIDCETTDVAVEICRLEMYDEVFKKLPKKPYPIPQVGFNVDYASRVAQAIGESNIVMNFGENETEGISIKSTAPCPVEIILQPIVLH